MRIKGKLVKNIEQVDDYKEAEIELPPVDISKIKEGDEVWVRRRVSVTTCRDLIDCNSDTFRIWRKDIIAHFPCQEKPPIKLDCEECAVCGKQLCTCPERQSNGSWKPKDRIEELDRSSFYLTDTVDKAEKMVLVGKLNQIIRHLNSPK